MKNKLRKIVVNDQIYYWKVEGGGVTIYKDKKIIMASGSYMSQNLIDRMIDYNEPITPKTISEVIKIHEGMEKEIEELSRKGGKKIPHIPSECFEVSSIDAQKTLNFYIDAVCEDLGLNKNEH